MAPILIIITVTNLSIYGDITNEKFLVLKKSINIANQSAQRVEGDLIFLDVESQGWREFGNVSIFVDDYPFWGNLEEYRIRNLFTDELVKLTLNGQLDVKRIYLLKKEYGVRAKLVLVTTKSIAAHLQKFDCNYYDMKYWCKLEVNR